MPSSESPLSKKRHIYGEIASTLRARASGDAGKHMDRDGNGGSGRPKELALWRAGYGVVFIMLVPIRAASL